MCSGSSTKHSCGHESRKYYFKCSDGKNKYYQELLPHRLVGRRFRSRRLCDTCERAHHLNIESDASDIRENEESAKALLEYFRGERMWPVPDSGIGLHLYTLYDRGDRLHPWSNRGARDLFLETARATMERSFQDTTTTNPSSRNEGVRLFQEMLDRQAEIDRTGRPIRPDDREFRWSELHTLAWARSAEYQERERARRRETVSQLEEEGFLGLYESDPEWLLNFDDWCIENCSEDTPPTELELRRDINGWFQHLRSCESRLRLDWMACAEAYRDGCESGNRHLFDYYPELENEGPSTFVTWCSSNASPAETGTASRNSSFINNLQGYEDYLLHNGWFDDLRAFQLKRRTLVENMRAAFSRIPGAPLSRFSAPRLIEEYPRSLSRVCAGIPSPSGDGSLCSMIESDNYLSVMLRFENLTAEALAFRGGLITQYRIEREEILGAQPEHAHNGNGNGNGSSCHFGG